MGHLMRCLALADIAQERGWHAALVGDIDEVGSAVADRLSPQLEIVQSASLRRSRSATSVFADVEVVHLDSYSDLPFTIPRGLLVSNMQDGPFGVRPADLAVDGNLGAEFRFDQAELSAHQLVGADAAVVRNQVLRQRAIDPVESDRVRVLIVMGGTDPLGLTSRVLLALDSITVPLAVTVVDPNQSSDVRLIAARSAHRISVSGFVDDLPALAREHDLAVSAAGTSVWDFACMGVPMALLCAVDNQLAGYRTAVDAGLAIGLGTPPHRDLERRVAALAPLLGDRHALRRQRDRLMRVIDGLGGWRIVAAWEALISRRVKAIDARAEELTVRRARLDDASLLFEWRNDSVTRLNSRSTEVLDWESHQAWLAACVADSARLLLIAEHRGTPMATVRWDQKAGVDWEVSITMAPEYRGRGLSGAVLTAAERSLPASAPVRMLAVVHEANAASLALFARAGYLPHLPSNADGYESWARWQLPSPAAD